MNSRVLVIDDDPALAKTLQMLLRTRGWEADVAYTGADAVNLALQADPPYVLAVVDCVLPDFNGFEVMSRIHDAGIATPIAMMSGYGPAELQADERCQDVVACYSKPVPLDALCELLTSLNL